METILEEAARLTKGDRQRDYSHPSVNFNRIAVMWSAILGVEVTERQVMHCQIALKIARDVGTPKRDNLVDIAGYARCGEMMDDWEASANG